MRTSRQNKDGTGGTECSGAETYEEMCARWDKTKKEKVYCKNCKYWKRIYFMFHGYKEKCYAPENLDLVENYYSPYKRHYRNPEIINGINDCKWYKQKWWKFWIEGGKRKILKGAQPKTDEGPKPDPRLISYVGPGTPKRRKIAETYDATKKPEIIPFNTLEKYLDKVIRFWRLEYIESKNTEEKLRSICYIDAFQSVRISILGELLGKEEK